jgi:hypothetical protein
MPHANLVVLATIVQQFVSTSRRIVMFLPPNYIWFEPVLIAAFVVFAISWIGNSIVFNNRVLNALATAIVFAVIFGTLTYFGFGSVTMKANPTPSATEPAKK